MYVFAEQSFAAAEFYPANKHIIVPTSEGEATVYRFGDALLRRTDGLELTTPEDFRAQFPDGVIPDEDETWTWINNAWFNDDPDDEDPDNLSYDLRSYGFFTDAP